MTDFKLIKYHMWKKYKNTKNYIDIKMNVIWERGLIHAQCTSQSNGSGIPG